MKRTWIAATAVLLASVEAAACIPYRVNGLPIYIAHDGRQCTDKSCCGSAPAAYSKRQEARFLNGQSIANRLDELMHNQPYARLPTSPFDDLIHREAARTGLDPLLLKAVIRVESNFNPYAVSKKGAGGLMQLMPETARRFGVRNRFDPEENIRGGARFLKLLLNKLQRLDLVLAAYNAGEGAVRRFGGIPPYRETRRYVTTVQGIYQRARNEQDG